MEYEPFFDPTCHPLHRAVLNDINEVENLLKEPMINVNEVDVLNQTPLEIAIINNKIEIIKLLVKHGAELNQPKKDASGFRLLQIAALRSNIDTIECLLSLGAEINGTNDYKERAIEAAIKYGKSEVVKLFLNYEVDLEHVDSWRYTALHWAAKCGFEDIVLMLLDRNINLNRIDKDGNTPLSLAAKSNHLQVAKLLLENGANFNPNNQFESKLMLSALNNKNKELAGILFKKGVDLPPQPGFIASLERNQFVQEFKNFKDQTHLFGFLFNKYNPHILMRFFSNPTINKYLSRSNVTFTDNHPCLVEARIEDENDSSDQYEIDLYKRFPNVFLFRNESINSPKFYSSFAQTTDETRKFLSEFFQSFCKDTKDIKTGISGDIHEIQRDIFSKILNLKEEDLPRFFINQNITNEHATTVLTVFDPSKRMPLLVLHINSAQGDSYFHDIKRRFALADFMPYQSISLDDNLKKYLKNNFLFDFDPKSFSENILLKNEDKKSIFTINCSEENKKTRTYRDVKNEYDFVFSLKAYPSEGCGTLNIEYKSKTPLAQIELKLQNDKDDNNCLLYSINIIEALVKMLKQPDVANRVFNLAVLGVESNNYEELNSILLENLKSHLVCYFNENREKRPGEEIADFHLKQRWEIGGKSLSFFYPPQEIKTNEEHISKSNLTI